MVLQKQSKCLIACQRKFQKLVMSMVDNFSCDESDDEREKKEILQHMECFNRLFVVASSSMQLYYEKYILKQPCMDSK
ncbi:hypothetical protein Godav_025073 [Gossypium davidsonii]|uniref:Uncharacterized protein n=1 Tax=Gossypium davidsonii TaxID=34287 RepID=A0A7J8TIQ2_GOSDV|nr:hypothetical protein [Gossypium davidsonii]